MINFYRKGEDATSDVDKMFKYLCSKENDVVRSRTISIRGRNVTFERTCGQVLDSTFGELCDRVGCYKFSLDIYNIASNCFICSHLVLVII